MTGGDQREPLWASSLADQPQREFDLLPPATDQSEDVAPRPDVEQPAWGLAVALGALAGFLVVALAMVLPGGGSLTVKDVPSAWGDVPMTCATARLEQDERALELFHCRAVGAGTLPPGLYRSPDSQWTSDITRRDARLNRIRITPDGELTGWALY